VSRTNSVSVRSLTVSTFSAGSRRAGRAPHGSWRRAGRESMRQEYFLFSRAKHGVRQDGGCPSPTEDDEDPARLSRTWRRPVQRSSSESSAHRARPRIDRRPAEGDVQRRVTRARRPSRIPGRGADAQHLHAVHQSVGVEETTNLDLVLRAGRFRSSVLSGPA